MSARSKVFQRSRRSVALGLPDRVEGGARQADLQLLTVAAPKGFFFDTTHFDTVRFPPPDWALKAFTAAAQDGVLAYTSYRGNHDVLNSLADSLTGLTGVTFDPQSELIITTGTQGGLFATLSAVVDEGDRVLLMDPDYLFSERILRFLGAEIVSVPLIEGPATQPDLEALERAIKQSQPRLLLFSHPNNPTGAVYSAEVIARIAELAVRHDLMVVVDELYCRLTYDGKPFAHLVAQPGMRERTITLFGPSKTESLTGYRIGVVAAPAAVMPAIEDVQSIMSLRAPAYSQQVLHSWIRDDGEWLAARLRQFDSLRQATAEAFRSLPWLKLFPQRGTAYMWPDVSALGESDSTIATALMRDAGVLVSPGYQFGERGKGHFRVCFARDMREWGPVLERMLSVLDRLARAKGLPARR